MDLERSPLTVDAQARETIKNFLRVGVPVSQALESAGVPRRTYKRWHDIAVAEVERMIAEGGDPEPHLAPYVEWLFEIEKAHSQGVSLQITRIAKAGEDPGNWRANVWLLQRMSPRDFGDSVPPASEAKRREPEADLASTVDLLERRMSEITARRRKAIDVLSRPIDA
jgi:hypothetical protein